jgi:hypothetical protein
MLNWFYQKNYNKLENEANKIGLRVSARDSWEAYIMRATKKDLFKKSIFIVIALALIGTTIYLSWV